MSRISEFQVARNIKCSPIDILLADTPNYPTPNVIESIGLVYSAITVPVHILVLYAICLEVCQSRRNNTSFYQVSLLNNLQIAFRFVSQQE
jgi:hypothetical protein